MTQSISTKESLQYAIIAWFAEKCGANGTLGKTALQKLVYALTEIRSVDTGYRFSIYNYGPFCKDVSADLDTSDLLKNVRISFNAYDSRYLIEAGPNCAQAISRASNFIEKHSHDLEWVADNLGGRTARQLELFTTLHYIKNRMNPRTDDECIDELISLKPKFERLEVSRCLDEVNQV